MKTEIFKSHSDFLRREDKDLNGVSEKFAEVNPDFAEDNKTNKGCWNCSGCSGCSGCSRCSDCLGCSDCSDCSGCLGCSRCSGCSGCSDCSRCSDCSDCFGSSETKEGFSIPKVTDLNKKVASAIKLDSSFNMGDWHSPCGTAHCWAGWITTLAGEEGGELERATSTEFAAMMIYKESTGDSISPVNFYLSDGDARKKIIELADL